MKDHDFTTTFSVAQTPEEVFEAIKNVPGWWGAIEGSTENPGDEFTYRHKDVHYSRQKLVEVIPSKKLVWLVTDASLSFVKDKREWTGTQLRFEISRNRNETEVRFTHAGLVQEFECFDACSNAWIFYIRGSLRGLIATGKGHPDPKEKGRRPGSGHHAGRPVTS
jgi:uncharacterized protein YndB with AHSA1/START domain